MLDLGCGPGGLALALEPTLSPDAKYVGLDVHRPSIDWCNHRFGSDSRFHFECIAVASPYGRSGGPSASSFRLPLEDRSQDLALARSLLTHLLEADAQSCLSEIGRVLAVGGRAMVTAFLFERHQSVPFLPFSTNGGTVRLRRRSWPTAAVGYERSMFLNMVRSAGLSPKEVWEVFYPGTAEGAPRGQDVLFLGRSADEIQ
jgi:ubiquinone/menaquinone biosynthesis C-methylase UbiE